MSSFECFTPLCEGAPGIDMIAGAVPDDEDDAAGIVELGASAGVAAEDAEDAAAPSPGGGGPELGGGVTGLNSRELVRRIMLSTVAYQFSFKPLTMRPKSK